MRANQIGQSTDTKTKAFKAYVEQNRAENPWRSESRIVPGGYTVTCSVEDRMHDIRRCKATKNDIEWLQKVVAWTDNGKTVQKAAESKLRVLTKLFEENGGDEPVNCVFCGGGHIVLAGASERRVWFVVCTSCKKEGPTKPTKEEAVTAWNAEQQEVVVNK